MNETAEFGWKKYFKCRCLRMKNYSKPSETHLNNLIKDIISSFSLKVTSKGGEIVQLESDKRPGDD